MTMTRETQLEIIGYLVTTSGQERNYYGQNGNISTTTKLIKVPVPIVCEDDTCTEVEVYPDGHIEITGWNGTDGIGDDASEFSDEEIDKLFNAFYGMA